jgi:hypothetical protein
MGDNAGDRQDVFPLRDMLGLAMSGATTVQQAIDLSAEIAAVRSRQPRPVRPYRKPSGA